MGRSTTSYLGANRQRPAPQNSRSCQEKSKRQDWTSTNYPRSAIRSIPRMREGQRHHRRVGPPLTAHEVERCSSGHIPTHTTNSHNSRWDACSYSRAEVPMSPHPGRSSSPRTSSSQRVASKLLQLCDGAHSCHRHSNTVQACSQSSSCQPRLTCATSYRPPESKLRND